MMYTITREWFIWLLIIIYRAGCYFVPQKPADKIYSHIKLAHLILIFKFRDIPEIFLFEFGWCWWHRIIRRKTTLQKKRTETRTGKIHTVKMSERGADSVWQWHLLHSCCCSDTCWSPRVTAQRSEFYTPWSLIIIKIMPINCSILVLTKCFQKYFLMSWTNMTSTQAFKRSF